MDEKGLPGQLAQGLRLSGPEPLTASGRRNDRGSPHATITVKCTGPSSSVSGRTRPHAGRDVPWGQNPLPDG